MAGGWKFVRSSVEGDDFRLGGVEVWKHNWWAQAEGEKVEVTDPQYGRTFRFNVYSVEGPAGRVRFAAGEFSNGVWGFYVPED